ncbi:DEAD-box ATP-dependent RNA helicase CshA [Chlamydiales bacterium STE3]|nr:DEAD-box ATP-dependent RNA helicase CshA [Chlamydiales bacterium STE3]
MVFSELSLDESILTALKEMNFSSPSAIQQKTIPIILNKKDLIARAQTGSGKTAACAIPICQLIDSTSSLIQALILVPTRELALQYATEAQKIGKYKGVKAFAIFGGEDAAMQKSKLQSGVQLLIATPGRLIDFIYSRDIDLSHVNIFVLDEADKMFSMGFIEDIEFIVQCLIQKHQTLLFSATMPKIIHEIASKHMQEPVSISLQETHPAKINHQFLFCKHFERLNYLAKLIQESNPVQSIVFCATRFQAEEVCRFLQDHFQHVDLLHAGLSQSLRTIITSKFRTQRVQILVATDVAARGLDFSHVSHVFIFELSDDIDTYFHQSGRTGRFEKEGAVISLVTVRELKIVDKLEKRLKQELQWIGERPTLPVKKQRRTYKRNT